MDGILVVSLPSWVIGPFSFVYTMKILNKIFLWGRGASHSILFPQPEIKPTPFALAV